MKTKSLISFLFVAVLLAVGMVSALSGVSMSSPTFTKSSNVSTLSITTTNTQLINLTAISIPASLSDGKGHTITLTPASYSQTQINSSLPLNINITASASDWSALVPGQFAGTITANATTSTNASDSTPLSSTVSFTSTFCKYGDINNGTTRYLTIDSVKDKTSSTKFKWKPGDEVTLEVKIAYDNELKTDDSINGILKLALYDPDTNKFIDFDNQGDVDEISVSPDETKTQTETVTVQVPKDITSGTYRLYAKVYQESKENSLCVDNTDYWDNLYYTEVDLTQKSNEVVLKDLPETLDAQCGEDATINFNAVNIGTNDENNVYVKAVVYDNHLKIDANSSGFSLDSTDEASSEVSFIVPTTASNKAYDLYVTPFYKHSDSSDTWNYPTDAYKIILNVIGCTAPTNVNASVTSTLSESTQPVIGGQVIVDTTIKNTGNAAATFNVIISGISDWATATIDPSAAFPLNAGESKDISISLNVKDSATEGNKTFTISLKDSSGNTIKIINPNGQPVDSQTLQLALEQGITTQRILNNLKDNWPVYTIVLVTLILIIAVIIVITSLVRRRPSD